MTKPFWNTKFGKHSICPITHTRLRPGKNQQGISYTIQTNKNALTAGPVTVANGVIVTVPNGSTWTVV